MGIKVCFNIIVFLFNLEFSLKYQSCDIMDGCCMMFVLSKLRTTTIHNVDGDIDM